MFVWFLFVLCCGCVDGVSLTRCPRGESFCSPNGPCFPSHQFCDGFPDCPGPGYDESNCPTTTLLLSNTTIASTDREMVPSFSTTSVKLTVRTSTAETLATGLSSFVGMENIASPLETSPDLGAFEADNSTSVIYPAAGGSSGGILLIILCVVYWVYRKKCRHDNLSNEISFWSKSDETTPSKGKLISTATSP